MKKAVVSRETKWSAQQWLPHVTEVAQACGLGLDDKPLSQLAQYFALLQHWNSVYNLTALHDPKDMITHHLADCLSVALPILRHIQTLPDGVLHVLDVGSGGGLPGVVLAIVNERLKVTCVDAVGKKAAFIQQVAATLGLTRLRAEHARVETLRGNYHIIASRAFASLPDFVRLTHTLLAPGDGIWMAMKGRAPEANDEAQLLQQGVSVVAIEKLQVPGLDAQRCLVWMRPI